MRRERLERRGLLRDGERSPERRGGEPHDHDGPEQPADPAGAEPLDHEQADEDGERERHDHVRPRRVEQLEPLGGREHRDRRGDHAVAEEHRRAEDAEQAHHGQHPTWRQPLAQQPDQREQTTLAVVVGTEEQAHVKHGHDQHHRPDDGRDHAVDERPRDGVASRRVRLEHRAHRVQRARADVAEDDAHSTQHHERSTGRPSCTPLCHGLERMPLHDVRRATAHASRVRSTIVMGRAGNGRTRDPRGARVLSIPLLVVLAKVNLNPRGQEFEPSDHPDSGPKSQRTRARLTNGLRALIIAYYEQGNVSALQTAQHFGVGKSTVLRILRDGGAHVRPHGKRLT